MADLLRTLVLVGALLGGALAVPAFVEEPAPKKGGDPKEAKDELPQIDAGNLLDLKGRVGQNVLVTGTVDRVGKSSGGHRFVNFAENRELTVFIASDDVPKFKDKTPLDQLDGKNISVCGKVERYKDKLQIQIRTPERLALVEKKPGPAEAAAKLPEPVELKMTGREAWVSPLGLRYAGRDPEGLTRKEHVLRHAKDIPDRDGSHGVFDGGDKHAFAWIDAAWAKIEKEKLKPVVEGERLTYTVPMGRRVGYLGGKTGAERRHPPLTRIFLVLRKGTKDVVTAFPK